MRRRDHIFPALVGIALSISSSVEIPASTATADGPAVAQRARASAPAVTRRVARVENVLTVRNPRQPEPYDPRGSAFVTMFFPIPGMLLDVLLPNSSDAKLVVEGKKPLTDDFFVPIGFTDDLARFAMIGYEEKSQRVIVDGDPGDSHQGIFAARFDPGTKVFRYVGIDGARIRSYFVHTGAARQGPFREIILPSEWSAFTTLFPQDQRFIHAPGAWPGRESPLAETTAGKQGARVHFAARKTKKNWFVYDGGQSTETDLKSVSLIAARPDGTLMVGGHHEGRWVIDHGGSRVPQRGEPIRVWFAPRSGQAVTLVRPGKGRFLLLDGERERGPYDQILLALCPGEDTLLCAGREGRTWHVEVGGQKKGPYDEFRAAAWSTDGAGWAFAAKSGQKWWIVTSAGERGPYDDVDGLVPGNTAATFSFAYHSADGWRYQTPAATYGPYRHLGPGALSPDGRHFAFAARDDQGWYLSVDGTRGSERGDGVLISRWVSPSTVRYILVREPADKKPKPRPPAPPPALPGAPAPPPEPPEMQTLEWYRVEETILPAGVEHTEGSGERFLAGLAKRGLCQRGQ